MNTQEFKSALAILRSAQNRYAQTSPGIVDAYSRLIACLNGVLESGAGKELFVTGHMIHVVRAFGPYVKEDEKYIALRHSVISRIQNA